MFAGNLIFYVGQTFISVIGSHTFVFLLQLEKWMVEQDMDRRGSVQGFYHGIIHKLPTLHQGWASQGHKLFLLVVESRARVKNQGWQFHFGSGSVSHGLLLAFEAGQRLKQIVSRMRSLRSPRSHHFNEGVFFKASKCHLSWKTEKLSYSLLFALFSWQYGIIFYNTTTP